LVIKGTPLYDLWEQHEFEPLSSSTATDLLSEALSSIPDWIRIQRIQRDVPAQYIDSGVTKSNLRQLIDNDLEVKGASLMDLRSREIGHMSLKYNKDINVTNPDMKTLIYQASGGSEIFLSLVEPSYDAVVGYLRLREIFSSHRSELSDIPVMIIRELKVLGKEIEIGVKDKNGLQHKGFGSMLLEEANRISKENFDCKKIYVLSGVGVKEYYRKYHGFRDHGVYLCKDL
jgi:elongator complex protein 3